MRDRLAQLVVAGVLLLSPVHAAGQTSAPAAAPVLEATRLDGETVSGRLRAVGSEVTLETDDGAISFAWSDLLCVRPIAAGATTTRPAPPESPLRFHLADGSVFGGEIVATSEQGFIVRCGPQTTCQLNLTAIRSIRVTAASEAARGKLSEVLDEHADQITAAAGPVETPPTADVAVVARRSDVLALRGRIRRIEADDVVFEWNGRDVRLPWARVGGLVFARPSPRSASCIVRLRTGDAFAGRVVGGSQQALVLSSGIFDELTLPWVRITQIDCRSERLVFLSELRPRRYEFEPFFDKTWDYATDRTLTGRPIRLGGREYARGVTMHSRASLTYALDGRFTQFAAVAGIVDGMQARGCVALRVIGDGQVLWEADGIRGGQPPRDVIVSVAGVQELKLVVDYDEELDLSDQAVWAFARLIR